MKCANTLTPGCDKFANEVADTQITLYWTIGRSVKSLLEAEIAETPIATATEMDPDWGRRKIPEFHTPKVDFHRKQRACVYVPQPFSWLPVNVR